MTDWSSFSIGNSAGFIKGPGKTFDDVLRSPIATQVTIGSITVDPREGNSGIVYQLLKNGTSINSLGLPNPGVHATRAVLPDLHTSAQLAGKQLRVSIAGFSLEEYGILTSLLHRHVDVIEINLGCPNVWKDGAQKPIASFIPELVYEIIDVVSMHLLDNDPRIAIKLSPYSNPADLARMAEMLATTKAHRVHEVVTSNTFPNGVAFEDGVRAIDVAYGGIAGASMRHIALGQVSQFANALTNTAIQVIGVGGIASGEDVLSMRAVGARGIQIGTAFGADTRGAKIFSDIFEEIVNTE